MGIVLYLAETAFFSLSVFFSCSAALDTSIKAEVHEALLAPYGKTSVTALDVLVGERVGK